MVFSSLTFIFIFLPMIIIAYFLSSKKYKNLILLIFSLLFYSWGEPIYVLLMLFSSLVDYIHGILIDKYRGRGLDKVALASSIVVNLSLLGFFKYSDFLIENINFIFKSNIPLLELPLPIGISFYTFQTMSYSIDVYRNQAPVQKNPISLATYVTLFPQLIAGPIVRYQTIASEINCRVHSREKIAYGIRRFIIGLAKKVLIANQVGLIASEVFSSGISQISVLSSWVGIVAYATQIYFDFSGYSDMAIGLGRIFGFTFLENFNYPYISKSITEFWRRWHISLGTWFKDYLYIPLGGNRVSEIKWFRNILIVWFATGLWHGSQWNFVIWGLYYGMILIIEKKFLLKVLNKVPNFLSHIYTIILFLIGWVFFNSSTLDFALKYIGIMFGNGDLFNNYSIGALLVDNIIIFAVAIFASIPIFKTISTKYESKYQIVFDIYYIGIFVTSILYLVEGSFNPFIYFRF